MQKRVNIAGQRLLLLEQWSPTFLVRGTGFLEDNFSMDGAVGGMVQAVMWAWAMGSNGEWQMKLHLLTCHSPPAVWLVPVCGPRVGDPCFRRACLASLVVQWLRIHLPLQGTRVRALVWEDPTCHRAAKPMCHNYRTLCSRAHEPQLLKPACLEPMLHNKRSHHNEKPAHRNKG